MKSDFPQKSLHLCTLNNCPDFSREICTAWLPWKAVELMGAQSKTKEAVHACNLSLLLYSVNRIFRSVSGRQKFNPILQRRSFSWNSVIYRTFSILFLWMSQIKFLFTMVILIEMFEDSNKGLLGLSFLIYFTLPGSHIVFLAFSGYCLSYTTYLQMGWVKAE